MPARSQRHIWDWPIRVCHWLFVIGFTLNYFVLEAGRTAHEITGYVVVALVMLRLWWGLVKPGYGNFRHFHLSREAIKTHVQHLRKRHIPADTGHNPLGWLFIFAAFSLFVVSGVTGFMMEEVDSLFGNPLLEQIHALAADTLLVLAAIHIAAVLFTQWRGRIALIKPMITGKR